MRSSAGTCPQLCLIVGPLSFGLHGSCLLPAPPSNREHSQVQKFMATVFFVGGKPAAPRNWPRNLAVPIALLSAKD